MNGLWCAIPLQSLHLAKCHMPFHPFTRLTNVVPHTSNVVHDLIAA